MRKLVKAIVWSATLLGCGDGGEPAARNSPGPSASGTSTTGGAGGATGGAGGPSSGGGGVNGAGEAGGSVGGAKGGTGGAAGDMQNGRAGGGAAAGEASGDGGTRAGTGGGGGTSPLSATTVYLAGDSTVSTYADTASPRDQAGWGQMLPMFLSALAEVDNRALGGRTARRFIDEGHLDDILQGLRAGDYLMVQFGTNDSNRTATYTWDGETIPYYLDPDTDYPRYLERYLDGARAKGATPVLVTPPPRSSAYCTGGNGTAAHAEAMRELGRSQSVTVVDLNRKAVEHLQAICPAPTPEDFFLLRADGSVDGTHFQESGARKLAGFVAEGLREASSSLARYLK